MAGERFGPLQHSLGASPLRLRTLSLAFLLGALGTGVCWFTLQASLVGLLKASPTSDFATRVRVALPFYLVFDVVAVSVVSFLILYLFVERPLRRLESSVEGLARFESSMPRSHGGALLTRVEGALARTGQALRSEQALTKAQLRELELTHHALQKAHTELVASDRLTMVGKLAAGVAHEIGNPLQGILGYVALLRTRVDGRAEALDMLGRVEGELQRIDAIVRSLLDLGRPAIGQLQTLDLGSVAENSIKLLEKSAEFRGVHIKRSFNEALWVRAEAGPVSQILINLLLNAAQAMAGQGVIELTAFRDGGNITLEVVDSGPGIPPDVLPRLFTPFFTTKADKHGTGLGLAVSRHLADSFHGTLNAGSAPSGGAKFVLSLPAS